MKTLKKVLALTLVFALALTCAISAAAYTDDSKISKTEAVGMLSTLNVINGKSDGSFDPSGAVTRGEMAKMIYTVRTGGNDDASQYAGLSTRFTDIAGYWGAAYVKYCNSVGIIAGRSNTTFDPNASVTGLEVAKMVLVNMGYQADKAGMVGSTWSVAVTSLASENGLFKNVDGDIAKACDRENAAQIIYNSLDCDMVKWSNDAEEFVKQQTGVANATETVGQKYFGYTNVDVILDGVTYDVDDKEYTVAVTDDDADVVLEANTTFTTTKDYSKYVGYAVTLSVKDLGGKDEALLGLYAKDTNVATTMTAAEARKNIADNDPDFVLNNKKYNATIPSTIISVNGATVSEDDLVLANMVTLVDQDGKRAAGGKYTFECMVATPVEIGKVTYAGKDSVTITNVSDMKASPLKTDVAKTIDLDDEDYSIETGLAKDDYVLITKGKYTVDSKTVIEKMDVTTATIDSKSNASFLSYFDQIRIGNDWYVVDKGTTAASFAAGDKADLLILNGVVVYSDASAANKSINDFALFTGANKSYGTTYAKLVFTDGTTKEVEVTSVGDNDDTVYAWSTAKLVTYDVSKNKYTLTEANGGILGQTDFDHYLSTLAGSTGKVSDDNRVDSSAVIFVKDGDGNYSVVNGTKFAGMKRANVTSFVGFDDKSSSTGFTSIQLGYAVLTGTTSVSSDTLYGYVTAAPYTEQNSDKETVSVVELFNGQETKKYYCDAEYSDLAQKSIISYSLDSDGQVCDVDILGVLPATVDSSYTSKAAIDAITAYDGDSIKLEGQASHTYNITDDTVVMTINYKDTKGVVGGDISVAPEVTTGDYRTNAFVLFDGTQADDADVSFILVDVNGDITA